MAVTKVTDRFQQPAFYWSPGEKSQEESAKRAVGLRSTLLLVRIVDWGGGGYRCLLA